MADSTSRTDASAAEFNSRFRTIVESLVDAVVIIDDRGAIDFLNPAAERMFGYSGQQVFGKNVVLLMPEFDAKLIGIGRQVIGKRADGSRFPLELAVSEVMIDDKRFFTGLLRDLTERRRLEQQLFAARQATAATNEAKTSFLRSLGHELRTPLTPIMGYAELLLDEALPDEQHEAAAAILRNAELLQAQLTRLLEAVVDEQNLDEHAPTMSDSRRLDCSSPASVVPAPLSSLTAQDALNKR